MIVITFPTDCVWKVWYRSRTTYTVSIETVAPLQDSALAERACSTVEFLYQETPGFISPELWPPNSANRNPLDQPSTRYGAACRSVCKKPNVLAQLQQWLVRVWADLEQTIVIVDKRQTSGAVDLCQD